MEAKAGNVLPRGDCDPPGAGSGTRVSHVCMHRQVRETGAGWAACVRVPQETRSRLKGELDYFEHLLLKGFPGQGNTRLTLDCQPPAARKRKAWAGGASAAGLGTGGEPLEGAMSPGPRYLHTPHSRPRKVSYSETVCDRKQTCRLVGSLPLAPHRGWGEPKVSLLTAPFRTSALSPVSKDSSLR